MIRNAKTALKQLGRAFGLEISRYNSLDALEKSRQFVLHQCTVLVDVGANHGQYAKRARECGWDGPIISFEPVLSIAAALETSARKDPNWMVVPAGLGSISGEFTIQVAANQGGASSFLKMGPRVPSIDESAKVVDTETVTVRRLDEMSVITKHDRAFLKADVQGFELEVLKGCEGILNQIRGLELEVSLVDLYDQQPVIGQLLEYCRQVGFVPIQIRPGFMDPKKWELLQMDVLLRRNC